MRQCTRIDNDGGVVAAADGSTLAVVGNGRIIGGTLQTAGDGAITFDFSGGTLQDLRNEGLVRVDAGGHARLSGTIDNAGIIHLNSTSNLRSGLEIIGPVRLEGDGVLSLGSGLNMIFGLSADDVLTNTSAHTIRGAGGSFSFGHFDQSSVINQGLIEADGANAFQIANAVTNDGGVMRGSGAGGLLLSSGSFDNQGTVEALDGSNVTVTADNVTAHLTNLVGGILTGGTYRAVSAGDGALVSLGGADNLAIGENAAELVLSGAGSALRSGPSNLASRVMLEDSLTRNSGTLRLLDGRDFAAADAITNSGLIEADGGTLTFPDDLRNDGEVRTSGGSSSVISGTLSGTGAFTGTGTVMLDGGTFSPGGSPGLMTFEGDFDLSQALGSDFFIGGTVRGAEYSGADIGGTLTLGGDLTLTLGDGFAPALRDVFTLFTATRIDGDFLGFAFPELAQGLRFEEWRTDTEYGVHVTPLPASVWFLGSALAALGAAAARRRRTQARTQAVAA